MGKFALLLLRHRDAYNPVDVDFRKLAPKVIHSYIDAIVEHAEVFPIHWRWWAAVAADFLFEIGYYKEEVDMLHYSPYCCFYKQGQWSVGVEWLTLLDP